MLLYPRRLFPAASACIAFLAFWCIQGPRQARGGTEGQPQSSRAFDVRAGGARGDGSSDDTEAIQRTLDLAARAGGGRVVVPPSAAPYLVSRTLRIRGSHVELHGEGAVLQLAAGDRKGQTVDLLEIRGTPEAPVENVIVRGLHLDGNYFEQTNAYRPRALRVEQARKVLVDGVRARRVWVGLTFGAGTSDAEARDCIVTDWDNDAFSASGDGQSGGCRDVRFTRCLAFDAPDEQDGGRAGRRDNAWEIEDGASGVRIVECVVDRCGGNGFAVRSHSGGDNTIADVEFFRSQAHRVGGRGWYVRGWDHAVRTTDVRLRECYSRRPVVVCRGAERITVERSRFDAPLWIGFERAAGGDVPAEAECGDSRLPARSVSVVESQIAGLIVNPQSGSDARGPYAPTIRLDGVLSAAAPRAVCAGAAFEHEGCRTGELGALPAHLRWNYHTPPRGTRGPEARQAMVPLVSPLVLDSGDVLSGLAGRRAWYRQRRPELVRHWERVLGKLEPTPADLEWFGDITRVRTRIAEARDGYTRVELDLPMEKDFLQPHVLLLPSGQGEGPFPAVIAWTSTSPDYRQPEEWWGAHLARRGHVVLCGWSFIRNYRGGSNYARAAHEAVYRRFGHWLPMAKMVHDARREAEYLSSLSVVDARRIGFIGFSLSAKAALYIGAFAPEVKATVAIDPHIAMLGETNYHDRWYLDWRRRFDDIHTDDYPEEELRGSVQSLLNPDVERPGFERNHHELLALCAPRAFLLIGCSTDREGGAAHSDDRQSWSYFNRAREVYELLGIAARLEFAAGTEGHRATSPRIDAAWQRFFRRWLVDEPILFEEGYAGTTGE